MKGWKDTASGSRPAKNIPVPSESKSEESFARIKQAVPTDAQSAFLARRNAQNLASVYGSARAAGSEALATATSIGEVVELLRAGVTGSDSFADTVFQVPGLSDRDAAEAMINLRWDKEYNGIEYQQNQEIVKKYGPAPRTATNLRAMAIRSAQNLASVSLSAASTGSVELMNAKGVDEAIELLCGEGVLGAPDSDFATTRFRAPAMDAESTTRAREFLQWNSKGFYLEYVEAKPAPSSNAGLKQLFTRGDYIAQNIVSVYSSAVAAGSEEIATADSVDSAIELLSKGVQGSGSFESTTFQVQGLTIESIEMAKDHLHWDERSDSLVFTEDESTVHGKRAAMNIASVSSSAIAAGAQELIDAPDFSTAMTLIQEGVYGSKEMGFDKTLFKVRSLGLQETIAAREHIVWDKQTRSIRYEENGLRKGIREKFHKEDSNRR